MGLLRFVFWGSLGGWKRGRHTYNFIRKDIHLHKKIEETLPTFARETILIGLKNVFGAFFFSIPFPVDFENVS